MEHTEHLVVDVTKCRGCRSCQLACSFRKFQVFNPARSVIVLERDVETGHTAPMICPIACDLCQGDPACVRACRYGALTRESKGENCKIIVRC